MTTMALRGSLQSMVAIATAELGYHEGKDNATKYQTRNAAWCGAFLLWCSQKNDITIPNCTSVTQGAAEMKRIGAWFTEPRVGDYAFFDFIDDMKIQIQHVELVVKISDKTVITIGGNVGDAVKMTTHKLGKHSQIVGYGRPTYRTE